ncbi:uncharacterized protein TNCV_1526821 [Trichonephila clavipes]|nr:uncharacterized protein TNCV_1526821 [Trichonephila clavipes]
MAPVSRCMSGNTCDCRMSGTYPWAVIMPQINTRGDRVLKATEHHTITPAMGVLGRCKAKVELRCSPRDLHTRTQLSSLLRLNLDSLLQTTWFHSTAVQFPRVWHHSKRRRRWVTVKSSTRNGRRDPKCPSARCLRMA